MKKLLLIAVTFLLLSTLWLLPGRVNAANVTATVNLDSNSIACQKEGYISPRALTFNYGDQATIRFKNIQNTPVEVRNVPGGSFVVSGRKSVTRAFRTTGSFTYSVWTLETDCEKATGHVTVKGGWWVRAWPWALAAIGTVLVIFLVSKMGRRTQKPPVDKPNQPPEQH